MDSSSPSSNLDALLGSFQRQLRRIDALEQRIEERSKRSRRRLTNLIQAAHAPPLPPAFTYRSSHLRLFVSHKYDDAVAPPAPSLDDPQQQQQPLLVPPRPGKWTLQIEGKLLVGHLDHASAAKFDASIGHEPLPAHNDPMAASMGLGEADVEVRPVLFTHLFERVRVKFQTLYMPKPNPMAASASSLPKKKSSSPSKKSRRASASSSTTAGNIQEPDVDPAPVDPKTLTRSRPTEMAWSRSVTEDAHGFAFAYVAPLPTAHHLQIHSVVAWIELVPIAKEPLYQASRALSRALFPNHGPRETAMMDAAMHSSGAGAASGLFSQPPSDVTTTAMPPVSEPLPPLENEIHVPQCLTMKEIVNAIFIYVHDRKLAGETEQHIVHCDEVLRALFGVEQFSFGQLQKMLLTRNLIRDATHEPTCLTYIMTQDSVVDMAPTETTAPALLQLDIGVAVPDLFPSRVRDVLRRIKRREFEYTSARTKARSLLMARKVKDEDVMKKALELAVAGHLDLNSLELLRPMYAALAQAAPAGSEAQGVAEMDGRLLYLLEQLVDRTEAARRSWAVVEAAQQHTTP